MKIIGWRIDILSDKPFNGQIYKDYSVEYGNSPIRDKKSRLEFIRELTSQGRDFTITALERGEY